MKILVAGDHDEVRRSLAAALQSAGHVVRTANDESAALAALVDLPHLVMLTPLRASAAALALLRQLRENPRGRSTQIVMVAAEMPEAFAIDAYQAGLDGELRLPHGPEYLHARLVAYQRRLDPKAKPAQPEKSDAAKAAAAPQASAGDNPLLIVERTRAWRSAAETLRVASGKFLTLESSIGEVPLPGYSLSSACTILLTNVQHEIELRIAIGMNDASGKHLAVHLFGPEGVDLVADTLGELGNICMGALKTALGVDSLTFTGGLPQVIAGDQVLRPLQTYKLQEAFSLTFADAKVVVHLGLCSKANLPLTAANLKEGMVLAKDVFNSKGLMLINSGTRLSVNMIEKLKTALTAKQCVQVMAA